MDEDTIAIEASFLNIKTGELNSFTKFYGACYDANIKLRDGRQNNEDSHGADGH